MIIQFEKFKTLLEEQNIPEEPPLVSTSKDSSNKLNKILRPQGVIIQDTWNNFVFPIRPKPKIDTFKFDTLEVIKRFRSEYSTFPSLFLPWHFVVEMVGSRYYAFNTRPLTMRYPLSSNEILDRLDTLPYDIEHDY